VLFRQKLTVADCRQTVTLSYSSHVMLLKQSDNWLHTYLVTNLFLMYPILLDS